MSKKSDYYFLNIKQIYPGTPKPSPLETEIWEEILEPYTEDDILRGIKNYRKELDTPHAPSPAKFRGYLYTPCKKKPENSPPELPPSPEVYLMHADVKAGRCKYFYSTYVNAVKYVLNVKLKEETDPERYNKLTQGQRYRLAVENGLFAEFDKVLDLVYEKGYS